MRSSVNILSDLTQRALVVGERFPAAGHFGGGSGRHTIQIVSHRLLGRVSIEATLAVDPMEIDWFTVPLGGQAYLDFQGESATRGFTFRGNYVWLRARLDRRYLFPGLLLDTLIPDTLTVPSAGLLDRILLVT